MNPGGVVVVILGALVVTQTLLGDAVARLGIAGTPAGGATTGGTPSGGGESLNIDPKTRIPGGSSTKPWPTDPLGRPY